MSATSWVKVEVPSIPSIITTDVPQIAKSAEAAIDSILNAVSAVIQVLELLQTVSLASPLELIVHSAVTELRGLINDLVSGSLGVYYLNVPILKITGRPVIPVIGTVAPFSSTAAVTKTIDTLAPITPNLPGFVNVTGSGGNVGFYNAVSDSLRDPGDLEKPTFTSKDYVSGVVVLVGAPTLGALLNLLSAYRCLLGGSTATGLDHNLLSVPQHVQIKKIEARNKRIRISWDPVQITTAIDLFNAQSNIKKIKVYSKAASAGLLPGVAPEIAILQFLVQDVSVFDNYVELDEPIEDTNYALGFEYEIKDADGTLTKMEQIHLCQNVIYQIQQTTVPRLSTGIPPDWIQFSTPLKPFPVVAEFLQTILDWVEKLDASFGSSLSGLALILKTIKSIVAQNKLIIGRLLSILDNLFLPTLGGYALAFGGQGGNTQMLTSLSNGLFNSQADPNRPPFDTGTELVAGFILMAGASTQADLSAVDTVINFIAPGSSNTNPINQALSAIDRIKDTLKGSEQTVLDKHALPIAVGAPFAK